MENWQWVLTICGGVTTIIGAGVALSKVFVPVINISKRIEDIERHEKNDLRRFEKLEDDLERSHEADQALYKSQLAIINHLIDGNHIDKLKAARNKLQEHIINNN